MSPKSNPLPFDMEKVWQTRVCKDEYYVLDTELEGRIGSGLARIRYLTDFIFVRDGKIVFPVYERCTPEFWNGVQVYGFMIGPTTSIDRWYIWSLHWWMTNQEVQLVRIDDVIGITKQNDLRYRNGNQQVLWLNSRKGYAYALMEPDESIAQGWRFVNSSWRPQGRDGLPACVPADLDMPPPDWWHDKGEVAGKAAWQALQRAWQKKKNEEDDEEESGDSDEKQETKKQKRKEEAEQDTRSVKRRKSSGITEKGKTKEKEKAVAESPEKVASKPPAKVKSGRSATSGAGSKNVVANEPTARPSKRKSLSNPRPAKRPAVETSEEEGETRFPPSGQPVPSPPAASEPSTCPLAHEPSGSAVAITPTTPERARALSLGHIVEQAPDVSAREDQMLREAAPRSTPGPTTPKANKLLSLAALVNSPSGPAGENLGNTQGSACENVARMSLDYIDDTAALQAAPSEGPASVIPGNKPSEEPRGLVSNVPDETSQSNEVSAPTVSSSKGDESQPESILAVGSTLSHDALPDPPALTIQTSGDAEAHSKQPQPESGAGTASPSCVSGLVLDPTAAQLPSAGHLGRPVPRSRDYDENDDARSSKRHGPAPSA
ncbi:hypothetical protein RhiLY_08546 [Ceratobasidium sp. AG-Ba]|nr:hypothetical protein RhiLY_08546 [Ceratobasidium sp. AG-Ba]